MADLGSKSQEEDHKHALEVVYEISTILNTGLDRSSLNILVNLCESGVNPEALAAVVQELRAEAAKQAVKEPAVTTKGFGADKR
mmetsp:Transcript_28328/g.37058  ORF Transcript_28328/g.37058 Transcript_28328/m.37058 type:complete len:84 (+) Transcript_28328:41-292(+)